MTEKVIRLDERVQLLLALNDYTTTSIGLRNVRVTSMGPVCIRNDVFVGEKETDFCVTDPLSPFTPPAIPTSSYACPSITIATNHPVIYDNYECKCMNKRKAITATFRRNIQEMQCHLGRYGYSQHYSSSLPSSRQLLQDCSLEAAMCSSMDFGRQGEDRKD